VGVPILGILENMSYYLCGQCGHEETIFKRGGGREMAGRMGVPFLGEVPIDADVVIGGDSGRPIVASHPDSASARAYVNAAETVAKALGA
jgi:ATP-binding protein involved in chromosome partitioning